MARAVPSRGTNGVLRDGFLRAALTGATRYRRAAGFFSSDVFRVAADEFKRLLGRQGSVDLVCSPVLRSRDIEAIASGIYRPAEYGGQSLQDAVDQGASNWPLALLSWAIANRALTIQVAMPTGRSAGALYHEKFGILYRTGGVLGFEGSANESYAGYVRNFERLFVSDESDRPTVSRYEREFDLLWTDSTPGLRVLSLHDAFSEGLIRAGEETTTTSPRKASEVPAHDFEREILRIPIGLELREYQREAIEAWFDAKGQGVLALATGTGKTFTALSAMVELYERTGPPLVVIIVAPLLHLADQWIREAEKFGLRPIRCAEGRERWQSIAQNAIWSVNQRHTKIVSLVASNATFASDAFASLIAQLRVRTVLIGDEVHNLGAARLRAHLPEKIQLRMGLSATPKRWMDADGTAAITGYFGSIVKEFTIQDGISSDPPVLAPYTYHPILVRLDDDEAEEYAAISALLARYLVDPDAEDLSDEALSLLLRRARLLGSARNKISALRAAMEPYRKSYFNLIYCGDGSVELEAAGIEETEGAAIARQIEVVTRLLGQELAMGVATYTAVTSAPDRQRLLKDFRSRRLQALIAIRCLDEGVDIPEVRRAFILASGTNPRQFVQRRGRLLRQADGKERAEVFDFVVLPPADDTASHGGEFALMRKLLERELARVTEFAKDALNGPQARDVLAPVLREYQLLHL